MTAANTAIEPVEAGWNELTTLIEALPPDSLAVAGPDGWAIKDHLVHIAAWELSLLALFEGSDRAKEMGAPGLDDTDEINAAIWLAHKDLTPEHALEHSQKTHALLMRALERMTDEDLRRSYNHYQPNDPKELPAGDRPALDWVAGNTYEHYAEHIDWINQLVSDRSAAR